MRMARTRQGQGVPAERGRAGGSCRGGKGRGPLQRGKGQGVLVW